jgi:ornithine cyclodeaminase/alanine dehydrogenase
MVDPRLVTADLTALVTGAVTSRDAATQRTAFVFRGMAVGDLALAALGYQRARQNSQGVPIKI